MSATSVSVLLPLAGNVRDAQPACAAVANFLESTGFDFEILKLTPRDGETYGALIRRGVSEAHGDTIVIADPDLPYPVSAIGDAIAIIRSSSAEVVFGTTIVADAHHPIVRWLLVDLLPDPSIRLKALTSQAARLAVGETKLSDLAADLEIAFLANKYGFRVEPLHVTLTNASPRPLAFTNLSLAAITRIRMAARRRAYRPSRRCPVCFANDVWTAAQIPGNVVRACSRCKCRYLAQFADAEETQPVRRVLRSHPPSTEPREESDARSKTAARRLNILKKQLPPRARILEIGVRDGAFGLAAASEFEYAGIDHSQAIARSARARGLDVYCATLANFVNTGPLFDAVALFHVFENLADPHDALGRITELLKPGGVLLLTTFDTEGLVYLLTERKRMAQNFRTHLILYSRTALVELLEHSGFEIEAIGPDFEHRDHRFLRHSVASRWPHLAGVANALLNVLPDPLLISTGSIRIVAKRRGGTPLDVRAIRSVEATHAR